MSDNNGWSFKELYYALGELAGLASKDKKLTPDYLKAYLHVSNMVMNWCTRADPGIAAEWKEDCQGEDWSTSKGIIDEVVQKAAAKAAAQKPQLRLVVREDN